MRLIPKLVHKLLMVVTLVFSTMEPKMHSTTMVVELRNLESPSLTLAPGLETKPLCTFEELHKHIPMY